MNADEETLRQITVSINMSKNSEEKKILIKERDGLLKKLIK